MINFKIKIPVLPWHGLSVTTEGMNSSPIKLFHLLGQTFETRNPERTLLWVNTNKSADVFLKRIVN